MGYSNEAPNAKALTVSLHLYLRLMETGDWLGLIPASTMRFGGKYRRVKALPIDTLCPPSPVGIVTIKDRTLTPLAQRFIEYTRKIALFGVDRTWLTDRRTDAFGRVETWRGGIR